jgi:hypothetical protein
VFVLLKGLPLGSRFYSEKRGGQQFRGWNEGRYATVAIVNAVRALQYAHVAAHSKKKPGMDELPRLLGEQPIDGRTAHTKCHSNRAS